MTTSTRLMDLPRDRPLVGASILSADFARLGAESRDALDAGADFLHIDVMDGHFVPNLSMGPEVCRGLRNALPDAIQDVHLMVQYPEQFVERFIDAGADHITIHAEVIDQARLPEVANDIREAGVTAGVSVKPRTRLKGLIPALASFDLVLVMSVEPGFSGQSYIQGTAERVELLRRELPREVAIEVDGGLTPDTSPLVVEKGAEMIVAASAIYGADRSAWRTQIEGLRG